MRTWDADGNIITTDEQPIFNNLTVMKTLPDIPVTEFSMVVAIPAENNLKRMVLVSAAALREPRLVLAGQVSALQLVQQDLIAAQSDLSVQATQLSSLQTSTDTQVDDIAGIQEVMGLELDKVSALQHAMNARINEINAVDQTLTTHQAELTAAQQSLTSAQQTLTSAQGQLTDHQTALDAANVKLTAQQVLLTAQQATLSAQQAAMVVITDALAARKAPVVLPDVTITSAELVSLLATEKTFLDKACVGLKTTDTISVTPKNMPVNYGYRGYVALTANDKISIKLQIPILSAGGSNVVLGIVAYR